MTRLQQDRDGERSRGWLKGDFDHFTRANLRSIFPGLAACLAPFCATQIQSRPSSRVPPTSVTVLAPRGPQLRAYNTYCIFTAAADDDAVRSFVHVEVMRVVRRGVRTRPGACLEDPVEANGPRTPTLNTAREACAFPVTSQAQGSLRVIIRISLSGHALRYSDKPQVGRGRGESGEWVVGWSKKHACACGGILL